MALSTETSCISKYILNIETCLLVLLTIILEMTLRICYIRNFASPSYKKIKVSLGDHVILSSTITEEQYFMKGKSTYLPVTNPCTPEVSLKEGGREGWKRRKKGKKLLKARGNRVNRDGETRFLNIETFLHCFDSCIVKRYTIQKTKF